MKGYKYSKASPAISSYEGEEKKPFKIPQPATIPSSAKIYSPPKQAVVVTATPVQTTESLIKHFGPSVIRIIANDAAGEPIAQGSGFLITTSGLVVTNYHIVKGSSSLAMFDEDGKVLGVATNYGQNKSFAIDRARVQKLIENFKGGVTAASKQQWVSTNVDKAQINLWLGKAAAEAPKMVADRSKICTWIAEG